MEFHTSASASTTICTTITSIPYFDFAEILKEQKEKQKKKDDKMRLKLKRKQMFVKKWRSNKLK